MEFGKLLSYEKEGNRVLLHFEKADGRLEAVSYTHLDVYKRQV